jgi:HK97 family phage portal protein
MRSKILLAEVESMKPNNDDGITAIDSLMGGLAEVPESQLSSNLLANNEQLWWGGNNILNGAFGTGTTAAGVTFSDEQALTCSAVFACLRAIAENLGSLPGLVYEQMAKQRSLARDGIPWQLLHDEPNPEMDSMTFWELCGMRLEARGNSFSEIERDSSDQPIALWPIHNSRVQPWRIDGKIQWQISTDTIDPRSEVYRSYMIPDRDMFNVVGFGGNGYIAPGTIPCGQEQIGFNIAVNQYGGSFFKQGGKPSGVIEMPGYIDDDDERRMFREDVNRLHAGKENWNKIAVLWNGGKWKEIQYGPEQAQMIQSSNFGDKRVCQFFRVPPAIVQIYDDFKFNSVDAMLQSFVMTCLRPVAVRIERAVNRRLLKYRDGRGRLSNAFDSPMIFEFLLEALLRGDAKKQAETLEIKRRNGIINANEWRALDNDSPLPGDQGEHYILPGGFGRLDLIQGPGNKTEQAAATGTGNQTGNQANSANPSQLALPTFDAHATLPGSNMSLVEAVESQIPASNGKSRGGGTADVDAIAREMGAEVLSEAVERIGSVVRSEIARLAKLDDDAARSAKLDAIKSKAQSLMVSAAVPAAKIFKRTDEWSAVDVDSIANELASDALSKFFG